METARRFVQRYVDVNVVVKLIAVMYLHLLDLSGRILQAHNAVLLKLR